MCVRTPVQDARVDERRLEQAAPMAARLADPAREETRVAARERLLDLLEQPALLGERGPERLAVVEEDVDPDPRVRAADARHVPERAARRLQWVVPVDPRGARLVEEDVRQHVRQVAGDRDETIVGIGADRDGTRAERRDEPVHEPKPVRLRRRGRREKPRGAVEEVCRRTLGPPRLGAADRVPADEAPVSARRGRGHGPLRRADVRDGAGFACPIEKRTDRHARSPTGTAAISQLRVRDGRREIGRGLDRIPVRRDLERVRIGIPSP